ncbi:hypothetical protein, partial [Nocardioides sp. AN3]
MCRRFGPGITSPSYCFRGPTWPTATWSVPFAELHFQYDDWWTPMRGATIQQPVTELGDDLVEALVTAIRQPG